MLFRLFTHISFLCFFIIFQSTNANSFFFDRVITESPTENSKESSTEASEELSLVLPIEAIEVEEENISEKETPVNISDFLKFQDEITSFQNKLEKEITLEEAVKLQNFYPLYPPSEVRPVGNLDFSIIKRGGNAGLKVLIAGGIQGDEPGGFSAAALLASHYRFSNAQIYIIPNLNFDSIIKRSRGTTGDMNRKFATITKKDPQYDEVMRLQNYILELKPDFLINLHDGSGFYSPTYVSKSRNPNKWGQSLIIDQESIDIPYGNLAEIAEKTVELTNSRVENKNHYFAVHNTHTNEGNPEMEKSLSWFGIRNNIASFGFEVSKDFNKATRVYYHLMQLEAFFDTLNIKYIREFPLSPTTTAQALDYNTYLSLAGGRVTIPLKNLKNNQLGYIPLPADVEFCSPQSIVATVKNNNRITVHNGNSTLTHIPTQKYDLSEDKPTFKVTIDGQEHLVNLGDILSVQDFFFIEHQNSFRINAIGAVREQTIDGIRTEANVKIVKKDFNTKYSIDKAENIYRVEIYQGKTFVGMFLVDFSPNAFNYNISQVEK